MSEARDRLRAGTANAHRQLDEVLGRLNLDDSTDYASFLTIQASVILPLEDALGRAGIEAVLPDWLERRRGEVLREDLASLGRGEPAERRLRIPATDPASLLGMAYVLEGSRLGAAYLVGRMSAPDHGTAFLRHGRDGRLWPRFLAHLEASPDASADPEGLVAGALFVFAEFQSAADDAMAQRDVASWSTSQASLR